MNFTIKDMTPKHWSDVLAIYAEGIATDNATFETELPEWARWNSGHREDCRFVAVDALTNGVIGWAALSPVSGRHVYRGVAEVSVYVAATARGYGVGKALLEALVRESEANGIWTVQAGIFPENVASIALHTSCGFREVGVRKRIGELRGVWRDVLLLERRSTVIGT